MAVNKDFIVDAGLQTKAGATVNGALTAVGNLVVSGTANVAGNLVVTGTANVTGNVTITGFANVTANANFAASANVAGGLNVTGALFTVGLANASGGINTTTANASTKVNVGANVSLNVTALYVGNSISNTIITQATANLGGTLGVVGVATFSNNVTVAGNLTVTGTTTYINTATLNIADNIITLNTDASGAPSENAGIEINRGTSANVSVRWNETTDKWQVTEDGTTFSNVMNSSDTFALGTKTTGNYVANLGSTTGALTVTGANVATANVTMAIRAANTSVDGLTTLLDSVTSTSIDLAAAANSVKLAYDTAINANTNAANAGFATSGTMPTARLGSGTATSTTYLRGDQSWSALNVSALPANSATYVSGNGSVVVGSGAANLQADFDSLTIANATSNVVLTTGSWAIGNSVANVGSNSTVIFIGNASVSATVNSSVFTGSANNASYLGGTAAASYQLNSTLSANVATLSSNNASFLGGTAAASYQLNSTLSANVATLTSNATTYVTGNGSITVGTGATNTFVDFDNLAVRGASSNVNLSASDIHVGNSIANVWANSITLKVANATSNATITPGLVVVGNSIANVWANSIQLTVANATSNVAVGPGAISIGNSVANASQNSTVHFIGNSSISITVNSSVFSGTANNASYLGGTAAASYQLNSTLSANVATLTSNASTYVTGNGSVTVGTGATNTFVDFDNLAVRGASSNVNLSASDIHVGNSIANVWANSITLKVANATSNVVLTPATVAVGNSIANVFANTSALFIGNSSVSATVNSSVFSGAANNASFLGGTAAASYQLNSTLSANVATLTSNNAAYLGGTVAASYQLNSTLAANVAVLAANVATFLSGNGTIFVGNGSANITANSIQFAVTNTTSNVVLTPASWSVGNSVANASQNTTVHFIGNSTVSVTVNSSAFSGTSNNALYLGGVAAAAIPTNTYLQTVLAQGMPSFHRLVGTCAGGNTVTYTADSITMANSTGGTIRVDNFNATANIFTTGAGGCDANVTYYATSGSPGYTYYAGGGVAHTILGGITGNRVDAEPFLYVWAIASSSTTSNLMFSTSSSAPTMPGSYTYKILVGVMQLAYVESFLDPNYEYYLITPVAFRQVGNKWRRTGGAHKQYANTQLVGTYATWGQLKLLASEGANNGLAVYLETTRYSFIPPGGTSDISSLVGVLQTTGVSGKHTYISGYGTGSSFMQYAEVGYGGSGGNDARQFNIALQSNTLYYLGNGDVGRIGIIGFDLII